MEYGSNQEDIMEIFKKSEKLKQEQELAKTQEETVAPKYGSKKQQTIETIEINSDEEIEETGAIEPYIGLNGISVSETGEISKVKYFEMLKVDQSRYSDIRFTPEEAKRVSMSLRHMSTGINAAVPMTCSGHQCPFASSCPYVEIDKIPLGRPCLVESQLVHHWTEQFVEEFDVDVRNYTELHLVSELAEFNIYEKRITQYLAEKHQDLMQSVVATVDHTGEVIENIEISRAWDLKERIKKGRMKVLEALMATRKEKVKLRIDGGSGNSTAEKMGELKKRIEEMNDTIKNVKPIKGTVVNDDK
jgi:hypothetical protein